MVLKVLFSLVAMLSCMINLGAESADKNWSRQSQQVPPKIKVLIAHDQNDLLLEVTDKYKIVDPHLKESVSNWRFKGKSQNIQATRGGLTWGEGFPGVHQLAFVPGSPETQFIVNGVPYKGVVYVYDIGGTVSAVNEIPIEDYLTSILTKNSPPVIADETLAAVVITARTNAYNQVKNPRSEYWDVDATQVGFKGRIGSVSPTLQNALRKTRFMVLSLNGKLDENIKTFSAHWDSIPKDLEKTLNPKPELSKISIAEANELAQKGDHAASLLEKAFPKTSIQLIHFDDK
jgi:stage II sporulation protein D